MNLFLPFRPFGRRNHYLSGKPLSIGVAPCIWLTCLFLIGLSSVGWGQCFNTTTLPTESGSPSSIAVGDFNGDGRADLAVSNYIRNYVGVLLGKGNGEFVSSYIYPVGSDPYGVVAGDFNGDGQDDLAVANLRSNTVTILLRNGEYFESAPSLAVGPAPYKVALGDFNGDGKVDLAVTNLYANHISVLLGKGNGEFETATNYTVGDFPYSVAVSDFNGDGRVDLVVANGNSNNVSVLLGNGSGEFGTATNFAVGMQPTFVVVGDMNTDGKADLAVTNYASNSLSVLLGNGNGGFGTATNFAIGKNPSSVALGDFNGDGKADLAVTNYASNNLSVLLGNGSGEFGTATNFAVGTGPSGVVVGDFNGDSRPDLAVSNYNSGNVSVLVNVDCSFAIMGVTPVSCATVTATERQLTFAPQYAGTTGQPISFSVVNEMLPTTSPGPYTLNLYTDNPTITLKATQSGTPGEASFQYNWLAVCSGNGSPRLSVSREPTARLQVKLLGNPVNHVVEVEVTGSENKALYLSLTDIKGRIVEQRRTERAGASEHYRFDLSSLPTGTLLLRASNQAHSQTVRVLKQN
ncbi:FG-GAP-like repeat-containing protein [Spirosoma utsteinense]|uniref:T9SS type A sorting domain-containing protein n=1 Tax=Spirosoma utsteinense TaxID=2585773 RepID=A0ABR6W8P8_9BACT|nr:FG-GAP-like repeat-containing protein [Spirosoma utsteinense]MBC3787258.1 hypothetical protein [Spirosoma utsteinense]MBC3792944.1 hypothetical protein [Spirosoma utsteinense]